MSICFILFLHNAMLLAGQDLSNSELFIKGNDYYRDGEYSRAIEHYDRLIANGVENGALFYNLANAHFKLGSIGYSILYYEKAKRYLPRDPELTENIAFARAFLQDRIEDKKPPFIIFILSSLLGNFTLREVAASASVLLSVTLICAILLLYKRSLFLKNLTISLLLVSVIAGSLLAAKCRYSFQKRGVIVKELAEIKSAPAEDATTEFIIHEGTDFHIIEAIKEWAKIRLRDGKTGWTTTGVFEPI